MVLQKRCLSPGPFGPRGHLAVSGDNPVWSSAGILWAEARDVLNIPHHTGHVPTAENYLAPDVSSAQVEKLQEEGVTVWGKEKEDKR